MVGLLGFYKAMNEGLHLANSPTTMLDDHNELQPDAALWREEPDSPYVNIDDYLVGAPQLVVEVAASSVSIDLHTKLRAYERNGVREYVVWRTLDEQIDWFQLQNGRFVRVLPDDRGVIESVTFPGLRLNVPKML